MKIVKSLMSGAFVILFSTIAVAQVSGDSIQSLRQQKQSLQTSSKNNDLKLKLAKLENTLNEKTREMENTTTDAQRAADDNITAANRLSADPQNKKLAREAETAADNAKKSAKRGRVAAGNLEDLKKEIGALKSKIAENEAKLAVNPVAIPVQQ